MGQSMSLGEYQQLVRRLVKERGFDKESVPEKFMLLMEEAGEFAKAVRKRHGISVDKNSRVHDPAEEAADVFWLLLDLCNELGIDLEQAFQTKEEKNEKREWK